VQIVDCRRNKDRVIKIYENVSNISAFVVHLRIPFVYCSVRGLADIGGVRIFTILSAWHGIFLDSGVCQVYLIF